MSAETGSGGVTLTFRALKSSDDRSRFDCGRDSINRWFREQASQAARKGTAATTVGVDHATGQVASLYALAAHRLTFDGQVADAIGLHRRFPMPAILIAQLGVDIMYQGKGVGRTTLLDVLSRLAAFYGAHGFHPLTSDGRRLAIATQELRRAIPANG